MRARKDALCAFGERLHATVIPGPPTRLHGHAKWVESCCVRTLAKGVDAFEGYQAPSITVIIIQHVIRLSSCAAINQEERPGQEKGIYSRHASAKTRQGHGGTHGRHVSRRADLEAASYGGCLREWISGFFSTAAGQLVKLLMML